MWGGMRERRYAAGFSLRLATWLDTTTSLPARSSLGETHFLVVQYGTTSLRGMDQILVFLEFVIRDDKRKKSCFTSAVRQPCYVTRDSTGSRLGRFNKTRSLAERKTYPESVSPIILPVISTTISSRTVLR